MVSRGCWAEQPQPCSGSEFRAHISVSSARKRSGAEMLATPSGVFRAASCSDYTRGLSRETGSLSRLFGSVETTAKCVSLGPAHCISNLALHRRFLRGFSHTMGSEQALVIELGSS